MGELQTLMACVARLDRLEALDPALSAPLRLQVVALLRESRRPPSHTPTLADRAVALLTTCELALALAETPLTTSRDNAHV